MAFVHEDKIFCVEAGDVNGDALSFLLFSKFVDIDDLDHGRSNCRCKETAPGLERFGGDPAPCKFGEVLAGHRLVGGNEEDIIEADAVWSSIVIRKLEIIEMKDERLAAAGGHPEGEFAEIILIVEKVRGHVLLLDEIIRVLIELIEELCWALEVPVKKDFGVEHRHVLEVRERNGNFPVPVDSLHVAPDVGVVGFEVCPDPGVEPVPRDQGMEEITLALFIIPFLNVLEEYLHLVEALFPKSPCRYPARMRWSASREEGFALPFAFTVLVFAAAMRCPRSGSHEPLEFGF